MKGEAQIGFTERETEIVRLSLLGLTNKEIADRLVVSPRTVEAHFTNLFAKFGMNSRTAVAFYWLMYEGSDVKGLVNEFLSLHPQLSR